MNNQCLCNKMPIKHENFESKHIGIDETDGRYAEVRIDQCKHCRQHWLHYQFEIEGISNSGQWYRGKISKEVSSSIKPELAIEEINNLESHYFGGSYFSSTGEKSRTKIKLK